MTESRITNRIRLALLVLAAFICAGTAFELWLTGHYEGWTQWLPTILASLGFVSILVVLIKPTKLSLRVMRWLMVIIIAGSLFGIWEHLEHNFAFELEIRPNATANEVVMDSLKGANPLLAPGILAFAGIIAVIASYGHPKFEPELVSDLVTEPLSKSGSSLN